MTDGNEMKTFLSKPSTYLFILNITHTHTRILSINKSSKYVESDVITRSVSGIATPCHFGGALF